MRTTPFSFGYFPCYNRPKSVIGKKKMKRTIYIILTILLGLLLARIVHGLAEIWLLGEMSSAGELPVAYVFLGMQSYLPPYFSVGLFSFSLIGGYFLGQTWWRIIYIEHRRWRKGK